MTSVYEYIDDNVDEERSILRVEKGLKGEYFLIIERRTENFDTELQVEMSRRELKQMANILFDDLYPVTTQDHG
jgi:hypothetical protein